MTNKELILKALDDCKGKDIKEIEGLKNSNELYNSVLDDIIRTRILELEYNIDGKIYL